MPQPDAVDVDSLELDPQNPRLPDENQGKEPEDLLALMARDYALIELARSFADNGYFQEEPLATIKLGEKLRVVEGNRRLAALMILSHPELIGTLNLPDEWKDLSERWLQRQERIPVLVYEDRSEITPFLGFRHISGVKKWEPVEKARFIHSLLEPGEKSFADVARIVGSRADVVRDNFVAYRILRQAREEFDLDTSRLEDRFGVFLRALSSAPVKRHLGVSVDGFGPGELMRPIPDGFRGNASEIISWVFGTKTENPVIRESRQITDLGYVLENQEALDVLRTTKDFSLALALTEGEELSLLDNLRKASYHLDEVKRDIDRHGDSPRVRELADRCSRSMESIRLILGARSETDAS